MKARLVAIATAVLVVVFALLWGLGVGPFIALWPTDVYTPSAYRSLEGPGSTTIQVSIPWAAEEYCEGQVQIAATESTSTVEISQGVQRHRPFRFVPEACFGWGVKDVVWLNVRLAQPVGGRAVIRAVDGQTLPQLG